MTRTCNEYCKFAELDDINKQKYEQYDDTITFLDGSTSN